MARKPRIHLPGAFYHIIEEPEIKFRAASDTTGLETMEKARSKRDDGFRIFCKPEEMEEDGHETKK
jgi:hypothetical protein